MPLGCDRAGFPLIESTPWEAFHSQNLAGLLLPSVPAWGLGPESPLSIPAHPCFEPCSAHSCPPVAAGKSNTSGRVGGAGLGLEQGWDYVGLGWVTGWGRGWGSRAGPPQAAGRQLQERGQRLQTLPAVSQGAQPWEGPPAMISSRGWGGSDRRT